MQFNFKISKILKSKNSQRGAHVAEFALLIAVIALIAMPSAEKIGRKVEERSCEAINALLVDDTIFIFMLWPDGVYRCIGDDMNALNGGYIDHFRGIHVD